MRVHHSLTRPVNCAGAGELHLEICLSDLVNEYMGGAQINVSDPVVSYRESVSDRSDHTCMAKSPNKHNRIYLEARPMEEGLAEAIDEGDIGPLDDVKLRGKILVRPPQFDSPVCSCA